MTPHIIIIPLFVLFTSSLFAQQEDVLHPVPVRPSELRILLGVEAGPNFSFYSETMSGSQYYLNVPLQTVGASANGVSFFGGVVGELAFSPGYAVQGKILSTSRTFLGSSTGKYECPDGMGTITIADYSTELSLTVNYITIATLLKAMVIDNFYVTVGPSFNFRSGSVSGPGKLRFISDHCFWQVDYNAEAVYQPSDSVREISGTTTLNDSIPAGTVVGFQIGVGYTIPITPKIFFRPELRFHYSLTNTFNNTNDADHSFETSRGVIPVKFSDRIAHSLEAAVGILFEL